ncbi:hypothetical protein A1OE_876 [Candidatus Endolissoclinum faulkneri L2]|uniref:Uncharacterized protein n=1 Tax=Candidatus Endolissoclinum faulkneri L2 TaxID=1193729 RepID=K7YHK9_9PROT|nr:hypothetical protein A1OE_876 [Candidatus Endolissoclinum faulkneri L2]
MCHNLACLTNGAILTATLAIKFKLSLNNKVNKLLAGR